MEIFRADKLDFDPSFQMGLIFAEGFYQWLRYFAKDKEKLARAFAHCFELEYFYAAVEDGEVMAIVGCVEKKPPPIKLDKKNLRRELGFFRGWLANWLLSVNIINKPYPFDMKPRTGSIEFVATSPKHRGKGVAYTLIKYVMETMLFDNYVLEVVDNNQTAIGLYERLGFVEFKRVAAPKGSGVGYFVYMTTE